VQNRDQAQMLLAGLAIAAPSLDIRKGPPCMFVSSPISPLVLDGDSADAMIVCLEAGLVPVLAPCPMAGATSPYSIVGTVLQQVAENLFMLAAKFAVRPEAPALWGGAAAAMDMRSADVSYGGIERSLMMLANIDMAEFLGLPCYSPAGSVDSCLSDAQLGAEKTWTFLTRCLSQAATGLGVGAITNGKAVSAEQMLIDIDLVGCLRRLADGVNADRLDAAAEEIAHIEHGGNFMMAEQTLGLLRHGQEYCQPLTFNRAGADAPPALQRAHEQLERIAAEWKSPVPEEVRAELESLLA
jgi:trimethylamine--corrinoid protein Co-methyltransferase